MIGYIAAAKSANADFFPEEMRLYERVPIPGCKLSCKSLLNSIKGISDYVLNVFIDIQTIKEPIQMDTDKMMTYGTFTMHDEKLTQS